MVFFTRTVWLNGSYISRYAVSQPLLKAVIKVLQYQTELINCEAILYTSIKCVCVFFSLVVRHENRIFSKEQFIVMYGLSDPIIFLHINYLMTDTIFGKKSIEHQMCAFIFLRRFI
jgi:hypothetical protein